MGRTTWSDPAVIELMDIGVLWCLLTFMNKLLSSCMEHKHSKFSCQCPNCKTLLAHWLGLISDSGPVSPSPVSMRSITLDVLASLLSLVPLLSCSAPSSACSHVTVMANRSESEVWEVWGCGSSTLSTITARLRLVLTSQMGDLQ